MSDEQKKIVPIDYTHREYESIRKDLIDIALNLRRLFRKILQDHYRSS